MTLCVKCEEEMIPYAYEPEGRYEQCQHCYWTVYITDGEPQCLECDRLMDYVGGVAYQCPRCQKRVKL